MSRWRETRVRIATTDGHSAAEGADSPRKRRFRTLVLAGEGFAATADSAEGGRASITSPGQACIESPSRRTLNSSQYGHSF